MEGCGLCCEASCESVSPLSQREQEPALTLMLSDPSPHPPTSDLLPVRQAPPPTEQAIYPRPPTQQSAQRVRGYYLASDSRLLRNLNSLIRSVGRGQDGRSGGRSEPRHSLRPLIERMANRNQRVALKSIKPQQIRIRSFNKRYFPLYSSS